MRQVRLSAAISVDGYIAGPNDEIDWIVPDPDIDFGELMGSFDTVLMGRRSYQVLVSQGDSLPKMESYVFSRSLRQEDVPDAVVSSEVLTTVSALKAASGRDIWLFGGGELFRSMLELGLVDAVQLGVVPVILGDGKPLLPRPSSSARLKLVGQRVYPRSGTVLLDYQVVQP